MPNWCLRQALATLIFGTGTFGFACTLHHPLARVSGVWCIWSRHDLLNCLFRPSFRLWSHFHRPHLQGHSTSGQHDQVLIAAAIESDPRSLAPSRRQRGLPRHLLFSLLKCQNLISQLAYFCTEVLGMHPVVGGASIFSDEVSVNDVCCVRYYPFHDWQRRVEIRFYA